MRCNETRKRAFSCFTVIFGCIPLFLQRNLPRHELLKGFLGWRGVLLRLEQGL